MIIYIFHCLQKVCIFNTLATDCQNILMEPFTYWILRLSVILSHFINIQTDCHNIITFLKDTWSSFILTYYYLFDNLRMLVGNIVSAKERDFHEEKEIYSSMQSKFMEMESVSVENPVRVTCQLQRKLNVPLTRIDGINKSQETMI